MTTRMMMIMMMAKIKGEEIVSWYVEERMGIFMNDDCQLFTITQNSHSVFFPSLVDVPPT